MKLKNLKQINTKSLPPNPVYDSYLTEGKRIQNKTIQPWSKSMKNRVHSSLKLTCSMNIHKTGAFSVNYHPIELDKALQIKSNHDLPLHRIDFLHEFSCFEHNTQTSLRKAILILRNMLIVPFLFFFPFFPPCFFGLRRPTNIPMPSGVQCKTDTKIGCTMCLYKIHRISKHFGNVIKGWSAEYKGDWSTHKFQIISNMHLVK